MKCNLSPEERRALLKRHRHARIQRYADRIKAVLLSDDGLSNREIARVLFLNEETVSRHIKDYVSHQKLTNASGGSHSKLSAHAEAELTDHLKTVTYQDAYKIMNYIADRYGVSYTQHNPKYRI